MKHIRTGGAAATALWLALAAGACSNQPTATPPAAIAQACISTNFGYDVLYATEWVKPLMNGNSTSWQTTDGEDVIFRVEKYNPLNETTTVISMLFSPAAMPVKQAEYCQGYYEPVLLDVDGEEQPVGPFKAQMYGLHMIGMLHYGGSPPPEGPYTLEYAQ